MINFPCSITGFSYIWAIPNDWISVQLLDFVKIQLPVLEPVISIFKKDNHTTYCIEHDEINNFNA